MSADTLGGIASDQIDKPGRVEVEHDGRKTEVDVKDADRLGVVVERIKVSDPKAAPLPARSQHLARTLRPGGDRLVEVECDPGLGGAVLRSDPRDMRGRRYYQVDLDQQGNSELSRHRVNEQGERTPERFSMTREELGRTIDQLGEAPPPEDPEAG